MLSTWLGVDGQAQGIYAGIHPSDVGLRNQVIPPGHLGR